MNSFTMGDMLELPPVAEASLSFIFVLFFHNTTQRNSIRCIGRCGLRWVCLGVAGEHGRCAASSGQAEGGLVERRGGQ